MQEASIGACNDDGGYADDDNDDDRVIGRRHGERLGG
jgi:hypothetical protein